MAVILQPIILERQTTTRNVDIDAC